MSIPSIAMIPSGYKLNKVYSVLPTDGSGDLITARTTTATRVNSDGLIEEMATGVPRLDYTGGGCPSLLLEPASTNEITYPLSFANDYWTKSGATIEGDASTAGADIAVNGDFVTDSDWTIANTDSNATSNISNGYLELVTTGVFTQASQDMSMVVGKTYELTYEILSSDGGNLGLISSNNSTRLIPSSVGVHTIYFQPNDSTFALKRYSGALDVQIDNVSVKEVSGFSAPSVDNPTDAFALKSTGTGQIQAVYSGSTGVEYTASFWIKRKTGSGGVNLRSVENTDTPITITNEWARYSLPVTSTSTSIRIGIRLDTVGDEVYIFGAQLEEQAGATSLMLPVTEGSTVSRSADSFSKTGLSGHIGQTEGVLYLSYKNKTTSSAEYISLSDGTDANSIRIFINNSNQVGVSIISGGGSVYANTITDNYSNITDMKVAIKYKSGDYAIFINGVRKNFSTAITSPPLTSILAGNRGSAAGFLYKDIKDLRVYNQILTDAELTTLTTI